MSIAGLIENVFFWLLIGVFTIQILHLHSFLQDHFMLLMDLSAVFVA